MSTELDVWRLMWEASFIVKIVLLLLLGASVLSWAIFFQKRKAIKSIELDNKKFMDVYSTSSNFNVIMKSAKQHKNSTYAKMYIEGHLELSKIIEKYNAKESKKSIHEHFKVYGPNSLERALKKGAFEGQKILENQLGSLATIGPITPFVGLFGTVYGIIRSFSSMGEGMASIETIAPGIAEALIATGLGLFAAIPAVIFYNYFTHYNSKMLTSMESFGLDFLNVVERSLL